MAIPDREASVIETTGSRSLRNSWFRLVILLMPVSLALIIYPDAITQDGPAHLASGKIANEIIAGKPVVNSVYHLQLKPLPNWAGQATAMLALRLLPNQSANCLLNLLGLWLPALGLNWLIQNIGQKTSYDTWARPLWISLSAMNVVWIFGFTSFLIGLSFGWIMLGLVWRAFESKSKSLFVLLTLGWCLLFLSHLVAYILAGIIFGVLLASHFLIHDTKTGLKLAATTIPSLGLLGNYRRMTGETNLELIWEHLDWSNLASLGNWAKQIGWIDPLSLASKRWLPFLEKETAWAIFFQPIFWTGIAASLILCRLLREVIRGHTTTHFPSLMALAAISLIGILGPDTVGKEQGHYLPQRVCLMAMGLFCLTWPSRLSPLITQTLILSWFMQVFHCIYFIPQSARMAGEVRMISREIRTRSKVIAFFDAKPWPFRANPQLHRDSLVVFAADDIASNNLYEAGHSYFPLQFKRQPEGLEPYRLERVSLMRSNADLSMRREEIILTLKSAMTYNDVVVILGDPESDFCKLMNDIIKELNVDSSKLQVIRQ